MEQQQLQIRMQRMRSSIQEFAARQPAVQMSHFNEDLGTLNATLEAIVDRYVWNLSLNIVSPDSVLNWSVIQGSPAIHLTLIDIICTQYRFL